MPDVAARQPVIDVSQLPPPTGYSYAFIGDWMHIDLCPDRFTASVRGAVERRIERFPELAPRQAKLIKLFRMQGQEARARGVERLAMFAELVGTQPVSAAFNLLVAPGLPGSGGQLTNAPEAVARQLAAPGHEVSIAELSQQVAVRVRATTDVRDEQTGKHMQGVGVQYYVPRPGSTDLVVLSYHTPFLGAADALIPVFDLMAKSFYFTWDP